jgi:hypothetical protein
MIELKHQALCQPHQRGQAQMELNWKKIEQEGDKIRQRRLARDQMRFHPVSDQGYLETSPDPPGFQFPTSASPKNTG